MIKHLVLVSIILLNVNCKSSYKYRDINEFIIQPNALKDGEPIKLLYSSQGPDYNTEKQYYIHVIVISQNSHDTVNILTPVLNAFSPNDGETIFNYVSLSNPIYAIIQMEQNELKNVRHIDSVGDPLTHIQKVARDPKFDFITYNKYPTVFGGITLKYSK